MAISVAAGRRGARSRALEGGVPVSRGARGAGRGDGARKAPGAQCVCVRVCARRACSAVLKDTSGRRRQSRCPGDVTARPSDNLPVPEPSADTRGGSCGGGGRGDSRAWAGPGEQELSARSVESADARLPAGRQRSGTCPAPFGASPRPPPPKAAAFGAHGHRGGGGNGRRWERRRRRPRDGRRRQLPPETGNCARGRAGASPASGSSGSPRLSPHLRLERLLASPSARGGRARWFVKRDRF